METFIAKLKKYAALADEIVDEADKMADTLDPAVAPIVDKIRAAADTVNTDIQALP